MAVLPETSSPGVAEITTVEPVRGSNHPVAMFLARRIATGILTLLVVSILIFIATNILPGNVAVVVRSRAELADVVARDPFAGIAGDPRRYQVTFLSAVLDPARAAELAAVALAPERVIVSGREIYAWHPSGVGPSALAKLLSDRRLGVTATARNWNTVTKLLELADE